ncbi:MAG TPA: hypothetical protein VLN44_09055 [Pyrinomonadaceae bacterium]|nr:hypothetical protein [Pyrinomonadaceae bacterium]
MKPRQKKALKAVAVFLSFAFAQVYVCAALPGPAPGAVPQQTLTARLTTRNNQPITVNGNAAGTGATILTGATIETPDQVGATIDLGDAGIVELQPNSKIQLDFDANGNVRVKVIRGCAVTRKKSNVLNELPGEMELYTDTDSEKTDKKRRHVAGCILPNGQLGSFGGGLSTAAWAGIGIGAGVGTALGVALSRGGTTSGSTPSN